MSAGSVMVAAISASKATSSTCNERTWMITENAAHEWH